MEAVPVANPPDVFIDSSAFFSACYSASGSARDLLNAAFHDGVRLAVSDYVLAETERNILTNAPRAYSMFLWFHASLPYRLVTPSKDLIREVERVVVPKDAPVIAGACAAAVTFVATYDRKDLLSIRQEILTAFGVTVATPTEILASL